MAELLMSDLTTEEPTVERPATDVPSTQTGTVLDPYFGELPEVINHCDLED